MSYKTVIQFALIIFFLTTIFFFYNNYFASKKEKIIQINENNFENLNKENNLIEDIEYLATDLNGNKYLIISEYGKIDDNDNNNILMTNVKATIKLFKKDTIYIHSLEAKYNTKNYDTSFSKNAKLEYLDHEIYAENIDLSFQKNFASLNRGVIYKDTYYELFADRIEIDLLTKNSKIFTNKDKKIKIIKK